MAESVTERKQARVSFRDPAGRVAIVRGRVIRRVRADAAAFVLHLLKSRTAKRWLNQKVLIGCRLLNSAEIEVLEPDVEALELFRIKPGDIVMEHESMAFPSYPHEWSSEMLLAAGKLTISLALEALDEEAGLKDATPFNVLFRGPRPIFVDLLSFEKRSSDDPTWLAQAQFVRTFLLPLLANKYLRIPLDHMFLTRCGGLEPGDLYQRLGPSQKIRPPFLSLVSLPKWLSGKSASAGKDLYKRRSEDPHISRFVLQSMLKRMDLTLDRVAPTPSISKLSNYASGNNNYTPEMFAKKDRFVREALDCAKPMRVLDIGCNTGHYSRIAARAGASVVSIDSDPMVVGQVWRMAAAEQLDILPLAVNLSRPSPAVGWLNEECLSFLDRARGAFDCVFMLAVIHHMLVMDRIPLTSILRLVAELTSKYAVIEFIGAGDTMLGGLLRGRDELHLDLNQEAFKAACGHTFDILRCEPIQGSFRCLYLLRKLH